MEVLPKKLNAYLAILISGLIFSAHVFVWVNLRDRIALLDNSLLVLWVMISTCILLLLAVSWIYLFLKSRLYKKHLLKFDPNYLEHAEFDEAFDEAIKASNTSKKSINNNTINIQEFKLDPHGYYTHPGYSFHICISCLTKNN